MGCAVGTIKYTAFLFNVLCALLGIGTVVINSLTLGNFTEEGDYLCIFFIVLGSIVFLISLFGCYGAIRENICLTWTYAISMLILLIGNAVLHFGYLPPIDCEAGARYQIDSAWEVQMADFDVMSSIQIPLACCGKSNYTDYAKDNMTIPDSCYPSGSVGNATAIYPDGCLMKMIVVYETAKHWISILSLSTLCVESVTFIAACMLAISFLNQQRRSKFRRL